MAGLFIFCCSSSTIIPQVALKEPVETTSMPRRSSIVGYSRGMVPHLPGKWHVLFANLHRIFLVRRAHASHTKVPSPLYPPMAPGAALDVQIAAQEHEQAMTVVVAEDDPVEQTFLCKRCVDTPINGVDTSTQIQRKNCRSRVPRSTHSQGRLTLDPVPRTASLRNWGSRSTHSRADRHGTSLPEQKPLKHLKEADQVEAIVGEEFKDGPTSQIAEHRLGLHVYKLLPNPSFYKGVHLKNELSQKWLRSIHPPPSRSFPHIYFDPSVAATVVVAAAITGRTAATGVYIGSVDTAAELQPLASVGVAHLLAGQKSSLTLRSLEGFLPNLQPLGLHALQSL
ncbi:hypothetical protein Taro_027040 [Colocasia esculenta]|uniref:Uncharacterized protein n=1 Tax=Colocasia esculenta TaxID=4460 RepID=A0A843V7P0_COLES|nr:hypothetical protein [Colocasia esculenta]